MPLLAKPTPQQLAWQDMEMGALFTVHARPFPSAPRSRLSVLLTGALFQYNIGEYGELTNTYACGNPLEPMPNASAFDAPLLNVSEWMEAVASYGGKCTSSRSLGVFFRRLKPAAVQTRC